MASDEDSSPKGITIPPDKVKEWIDTFKELSKRESIIYAAFGDDYLESQEFTLFENYLLAFIPHAVALEPEELEERLAQIENAAQAPIRITEELTYSDVQNASDQITEIKNSTIDILYYPKKPNAEKREPRKELENDIEAKEILTNRIEYPDIYIDEASNEFAHYRQVLKRLKLSYEFVRDKVRKTALQRFKLAQKYSQKRDEDGNENLKKEEQLEENHAR